MTSPTRLARTAGLFYLLVAVLGGPPQLFVRPHVRVSADPAATADNILANATLLRVAFVGELVAIACFILLAMALYRLLQHVDRQVAAAMVTFVAIAVAILSINMLNHFAALLVATDTAYATALGPDGTSALALLFLELHDVGYGVAEIFFGLWLLPLGYLAHRSGYFPRTLGVLLMVGCFAYVTLALAVPLFDGLAESIVWVIATPAAVAEFWMIGYLLVKGINTRRPDRVAVTA